MLRTPSRVNGTSAHFFSRRWAHTRLSTKACPSEGDGGRSTGSGTDIVKLVGRGSTRRRAPRPSGRQPKPPAFNAENFEIGRGNRIRTCDPLVPNQMRYQTAPCPEPAHLDKPSGGRDPITVRLGWSSFRPRATTPAPAKSRAASTCSCRTARRPDRPPPSPFDCAGRAKDSTP
jgi:hypothetical protein